MRALELLGRRIGQALDRAAPIWPPRNISLGLQGGGSFGAFTSGVLDRLLEEPDIRFDTLSGASAGAINAVLLAAGLAEGGREVAREKLESFWRRLSHSAPFFAFANPAAIVPRTSPGTLPFWTRLISPYQYNPLDLNPLRTLLNEEIDFEKLRQKQPVGLLISATRVSDGRSRVFSNDEIDADALLASACLPLLHHAVMIENEPYWDGGYSSNPPLHELVATSATPEILIVQITPSQSAAMPTTSQEIMRRVDQITFSASLLAETAQLARYARIYRGIHGLFARDGRKWRQLTLHRIIAEEQVTHLAEASASNLDWRFLSVLREHGREAAGNWLQGNSETAPVPHFDGRDHPREPLSRQ